MFNRTNLKSDVRPKKKLQTRGLFLEPLEARELLAGVAELLSDVNPGMTSSGPGNFTPYQDGVVFSANGTEIWKSDGTSSGTVLIKDIAPSAGAFAQIGQIVPINGQLAIGLLDPGALFGDPADDRVELWKTDGTTSGTTLVKDFGLGSTTGCLSCGAYLTEASGKLFGAVSTPATGGELFTSDLTSAGTVVAKDIVPGSVGSIPNDVVSVNGTLYFSANNLTHGRELWTSDGTSAGTVMLEDLNSGVYGSYPTAPVSFASALYFGALDPGADDMPGSGGDDRAQLWKTDGSTGGATLVENFSMGSYTYLPQLTPAGGKLFAVVDTPASGNELWMTDGSTGGAQLVKDINPSGGSYPYYLTNVNGTLFFTADDGTNGGELWKSDGTSSGTMMVKDIRPGSVVNSFGTYPKSSFPFDLNSVNGTLYFTAIDDTSGGELWKSDGTSAGTVMVQDINSGSAGSYPYGSVLANGSLYFSATDVANGNEPWVLGVTEPDKLGVYRDSLPDGHRRFYLNVSGTGTWNTVAGGDRINVWTFGDQPIVGDWDGDGDDDIGVYRDSLPDGHRRFYLDTNGDGVWSKVSGGDSIHVWTFGDRPIVGDWDGDGDDDLGVYRDSLPDGHRRFYLDTNGDGDWSKVSGGDSIHVWTFGDQPLIGDWDGDGDDDLGVYRDSLPDGHRRFYRDANGDGVWSKVSGGDTIDVWTFGDLPVVGDWDADGDDDVGVYRDSLPDAKRRFYLDTNGDGVWSKVSGGDTINVWTFGDLPIVGKWPAAAPLLAAGGASVFDTGAAPLTNDELAPIVQHAISLWSKSGADPTAVARLQDVQVRIADLPGARLGEALGNTITLDVNAAGYGWFVDATPGRHEEFAVRGQHGLRALENGPAADRVDLLTAVMHELGHLLGEHHETVPGVMSETLSVGTRLLYSRHGLVALDAALAAWDQDRDQLRSTLGADKRLTHSTKRQSGR